MSQFSCQYSEQWPLNTLYKWFAQAGGGATADVSGATIGNDSIVTVQATSNQYIRQITVEEVNDLLYKVSNCSGCINDLFGQATEFLNPHSEVRSTVGAFLYAATAYDRRVQNLTQEGIELEKIKKVLDQALSDYQQSHNEQCLHSVIKYHNADVVKYLLKEYLNWSECHIEGCLPLKLADRNEKILALLGYQPEEKIIESLKQAYRKRDKIPLLMGGELSIEEHYTTLAIITDQEKKETDKELKEENKKSERNTDQELRVPVDPRPTTNEMIFHPKKPILLEEIFEREELKKASQKRVLIQGSAGIGKSILCQRIAYEWSQGKLWPQFKAVFWVKFRNLTKERYSANKDYTIYEVIKRECGFGSDQIKDLLRQREFQESCLLILDGYDELPDEKLKFTTSKEGYLPILEAFQEEFPHIIVTTRPQGVEDFKRKADLEILGFEEKGINSYIEKFFPQDKQKEKEELKNQLSDPLVNSLCHIPINLEVFCSLVCEGKNLSKSASLNLAGIYEELTDWLIKRHLIERTSTKKQDIEERVFPKKNPEVINVLKALEDVAWKAMESNKLYVDIKSTEIDEVFESNNVKISQITNVGPFRICNGEGQFIHLTFQEFFAAKYLVRLIRSEKIEEARKILQKKKFHPCFQLVLSMAAGLLANKKDKKHLQMFFNILHELPRDLGESRELVLFASYFEECGSYVIRIKQHRDFVQKVCETLIDSTIPDEIKVNLLIRNHQLLIQQEILGVFDKHIKQLLEVVKKISSRGTLIPEQIVTCLSVLVQNPVHWFEALPAALVLGEVAKGRTHLAKKTLEEFTALLRHPKADSFVKGYATLVLREVSKEENPLPQEAIDGLIAFLRDPEVHKDAKRFAAEALGEVAKGGETLPKEAVEGLIALLLDASLDSEYSKRWNQTSAAEALGEVVKGENPLTKEALDGLIALIRDPQADKDVKSNTMKVLENIVKEGKPLPKETLEALMALLRDPQANSYDKNFAVKALEVVAKEGNHLNKESLEEISIGFLRDPQADKDVKCSALFILVLLAKEGSPISKEALDECIALLRDPQVDTDTKPFAVLLIAEIAKVGNPLPQEALDELIALLRDPQVDRDIKDLAAFVLVAKEGENPLSKETLDEFIALLRKLQQTEIEFYAYGTYALVNVVKRRNFLAKEALEGLIVLLRGPQADREVKVLTASALAEIAKGGNPMAPEAFECLIAVFRDPQCDREVKVCAALALAEIAKGGNPIATEAFECLIAVLRDPQCDREVKNCAALALVEIAKGGNPMATEAFEHLIAVLRDPQCDTDAKKSAGMALLKAVEEEGPLVRKALEELNAFIRDSHVDDWTKFCAIGFGLMELEKSGKIKLVKEGEDPRVRKTLDELDAVIRDPQVSGWTRFCAIVFALIELEKRGKFNPMREGKIEIAKGLKPLSREKLIEFFSKPQMNVNPIEVDQRLKSFEIQKYKDIKLLSNFCKLNGRAFYEIDGKYFIANQREVYEVAAKEKEGCLVM